MWHDGGTKLVEYQKYCYIKYCYSMNGTSSIWSIQISSCWGLFSGRGGLGADLTIYIVRKLSRWSILITSNTNSSFVSLMRLLDCHLYTWSKHDSAHSHAVKELLYLTFNKHDMIHYIYKKPETYLEINAKSSPINNFPML